MGLSHSASENCDRERVATLSTARFILRSFLFSQGSSVYLFFFYMGTSVHVWCQNPVDLWSLQAQNEVGHAGLKREPLPGVPTSAQGPHSSVTSTLSGLTPEAIPGCVVSLGG